MRTVGQILHQVRQSKKLELEDVARITKIRTSFLEAIEADDYQKLPSGTVAKGFIKNYCEFLNLDVRQVSAVFRRDFVENELGQVVPRGMVKPIGTQSIWTPKTTFIALATLIFTIFAGYLFYQFHVLTGPPPLKLIEPTNNQSVTDSTVEIFGTTDPEATISVNNQLIALDKGGQFRFRIPMSEGPNTIAITATSKYGKTTTVTRTVVYLKK